jgi:flagellar hook-length control protein FliK
MAEPAVIAESSGADTVAPVALVASTAADAPGDLPPTLAPTFAPTQITPVAVSVPVAASPVAAPPTPFATQVATPIFTLAAAGPGEHVMTIDITPDTLGPITVRAHVGAEGVRVELFAPTDLARDAIRAILPDIRRDMTGAGLGTNLDLSSQNQPADRGQGDGQPRRDTSAEQRAAVETAAAAERPWLLSDPSTTIDVMA